MKKRSLVATIAAVACIAAVGIGSTFAYFTDSTQVLGNVFTMGNVDIAVQETFAGETKTVEDTAQTITLDKAVVPQQEISKVASVLVKENCSEAYVFVEVESPATASGAKLFNIPVKSTWTKVATKDNKDVYAYNTTVTTENQAATLSVFDNVTVANIVKGDYTASTATIGVKAYAIQALKSGADTKFTAKEAFDELRIDATWIEAAQNAQN